ncbi:class I SAM-dependent methyltransferase [Schinkia sp. CFF1]
MKKANLFFLQYMLNPRKVGAVYPSSGYLAEKMISSVCFDEANYIVEYGPGTGVFTEKILKYRKPATVVMLIENNIEFYRLLKEKYNNQKNLIIVHGSAEDIDSHLNEFNIPYIDYVISGLPFASLPKNVSEAILDKTQSILGSNGKFITFQYTLFKKAFISEFFKQIDVKREYRNVPPAYVFSCNNE